MNMEIRYKKLSNYDLDQLMALKKLFEQIFTGKDASIPDPVHLQQLLYNKSIIFYVALSGQEVIGGLTTYILPSIYSVTPEAYIYDLAVRRQYQRKGIGRKLLNSLKEYCLTLGIKDLFVQANSEDQPAIGFYKAMGGIAASVVQFSYKI